MRIYMLIIISALAVLSLSAVPSAAQEDCPSPLIIPEHASGDTLIDIKQYADDYSEFCNEQTPGPDIVFRIDGYDEEIHFEIINMDTVDVELEVIFTFYCDPAAPCNVKYDWIFHPGTPVTFSPTISQPIFVVIDCLDCPSDSTPLLFLYGDATATEESSWGAIKEMFRE